jgi:3'-5' exoribonuclease
MNQFPSVTSLTAGSTGWGFYLCSQKDVRPSRTGDLFMALTLQDRTGLVRGRVFNDVDKYREEFDAGDFVKLQGRVDLYNGHLQLVVERIRRVNPDQDAAAGFRQEACVLCADRPIEEMWDELQTLADGINQPHLRALVQGLIEQHAQQLRRWPAAQVVHHAYRGGFLEHVLSVCRVAVGLAVHYGADRDIVLTGAILHDIGKLQELEYDLVARYSREGNLVGHIALGLVMVREAAAAIPDFPVVLRTQIEHLIVSHHGSKEFGSPVAPMTIEALILSAADDLDAKINQATKAIAAADAETEFTPYHPRLGRVLWKGEPK